MNYLKGIEKMIVLCNRKLKKIDRNGRIVWSINFKAPGWEFMTGVLTTLIFFAVYSMVSYIE